MTRRGIAVDTIIATALVGTIANGVVVWTDQPEPYDRALYRHWVDEDRDGQNTRQEVLIAEAHGIPVLNESGVKVVLGHWLPPYGDEEFVNPSKLDIDHLVPLKEVHLSGGHSWSPEKRRAYANDLEDPLTLVAVSRRFNRSKGARDPAHWMPGDEGNPEGREEHRRQYAEDWCHVKLTWGMTIDAAEHAALLEHGVDCGGKR